MFKPSQKRDENGPYWYTPQFCYLHTLTFADPEPSYVEARRRWHSFAVFLERSKRWGVCVPQWGEKTGRLHFHLVSTERWDSGEMWKELPKYGFGRYDVRERPVEVAVYAARYVGRMNGRPPGLEGSRLWSVFGRKYFPHGVSRAADCKETVKTCFLVADKPQIFADSLTWRISHGDTWEIHLKLRADSVEGGPSRMNEIKPEHSKILLSEIAKGGFVGCGEYRSCNVTTREMADFKDKSKKTNQVFVEHRIEFGGLQVIVEERLPVGSDAKTVKPPAQSGEVVGFVAQKMKVFNTKVTWTGRLVPLK